MPNVIVVGAQWGDEGKGKIIDLLTPQADVVVRFQGGANAGHTVVIGERQTILHLVPSGILHPRCRCIIGNGVVADPDVLLDEIEGLHQQGYLPHPERLTVSDKAHVVMPYHRRLDLLQEEALGAASIGTTGRGIGPAYVDKVSRMGIRFGDLIDAEEFARRLDRVLVLVNQRIASLKGSPVDRDELIAKAAVWADKLKPHIADTTELLHGHIARDERVLFEGAQGTALDIDHGTYPFVTSSNTIAGGALCGAGVGPTVIDDVLGIAKAYTTRVGHGPFPTELTDDIGAHLQRQGKEFGATTGRQRRCGWFDAVVLRHAVRVNGITRLALTKLDVLSGLPSIKLCVAYELDGMVRSYPPSREELFERLVPIYEDVPGWSEDIAGARHCDDLPDRVRAYIAKIEELVGVPVDIISVGRERNATIVMRNLF